MTRVTDYAYIQEDTWWLSPSRQQMDEEDDCQAFHHSTPWADEKTNELNSERFNALFNDKCWGTGSFF